MNEPTGAITAADDLNFNVTAEGGHDAGVSFADILRALSKNKWLILVCALLCACGAGIYLLVAKPVYEAEATIRIDPGRAGSLGLSDLLSMASGEGSGEEIQTEMAILSSDQVAMATLDSLTAQDFHAVTGLDKGVNLGDPNTRLTRAQEAALGNFKLALKAKQVEGTQLIGIHFQNANPALAATVLNHLIDAYIHGNFNSRYESVQQVTSWLSQQMEELRQHASDAQKKLSDYQELHNIAGTDPQNNTTVDRLKLLNQQMTQAEGDRIVKEAQMKAAETGDPAILAALMPDVKLQALQQQQASLYSQYVALSAKFGTAYPPLQDVKQQLGRVQQAIADNVSTITGKLHEDYDASIRAENMLRAEVGQETEKAYALNRTQADYAVLMAEASSSRDLSDTLTYKLQQASVDAGLNSVNTMIVDHARAPIIPVWPKKLLVLAFALALGASVGVGAALLRESMSDQVKTMAEVENATGLVGLAVVPHIASVLVDQTVTEPTTQGAQRRRIISLDEPRSRGAEAYRNLRNSILLSSIDRPSKVVLVTSSLPGEGKSSTTVNYAVVTAQRGGKVLLIDTDLRRPTLHTFFGVPNQIGLSDILLSSVPNTSSIVPISELPNLHFLPAGPKVTFPSEALGSAKFRNLVEGWSREYDTVILDSAPVLAVSDTTPVASWVDLVIVVVRAGVTPVKAVQRLRTILQRARVRVAGILFNDVTDLSTEYGYGYRYYGKGDENGYYN